MMVFTVLAALHHRNRTGQGQRVEVAMGEAVTAMIPEAVLDYTMNGRETFRNGNRDPHMAPHDVYPSAGRDQWVAIAVSSDEEWQALCGVIGRPSLAEDPRFSTCPARLARQDEIDEMVAGWTRGRTKEEVMHALQAVGVPAGAVMSTEDQMADAHFLERGFAVEMDHPEVGRRTVAGLPAKFSASPQLAYGPAPMFGEHNHEIFHGLLGLDDVEIARLQAEQVVY
jgi:crotonobetainyl-CoA:carnitine CoA-transferase CaiB-like acyl-CoA transferase